MYVVTAETLIDINRIEIDQESACRPTQHNPDISTFIKKLVFIRSPTRNLPPLAITKS